MNSKAFFARRQILKGWITAKMSKTRVYVFNYRPRAYCHDLKGLAWQDFHPPTQEFEYYTPDMRTFEVMRKDNNGPFVKLIVCYLLVGKYPRSYT